MSLKSSIMKRKITARKEAASNHNIVLRTKFTFNS